MRLSFSKRAIGRGVTLTLLSALLFVPLFLTLYNWGKDFGFLDPRKAEPIAMQQRAVDTNDVPKLFTEPLLSVTFDDGWGSVFTVAYPMLQKYGIHTTQFVLSGQFKDQQYMSKAQVKAMQSTGHQIGCHTVDHADLTLPTLSKEEVNAELRDCQSTLQEFLGPIKDFATPYSSYNSKVLANVKQYYRSHRNTDGDPTNGIADPDMNTPANFDPYGLTSVTIHRDTTPEEIQRLIDYAIAHKSWLILTYHAVDEGPSEYGLGVERMERQLKVMSRSPIRIATVGDVLDAYEAIHE